MFGHRIRNIHYIKYSLQYHCSVYNGYRVLATGFIKEICILIMFPISDGRGINAQKSNYSYWSLGVWLNLSLYIMESDYKKLISVQYTCNHFYPKNPTKNGVTIYI